MTAAEVASKFDFTDIEAIKIAMNEEKKGVSFYKFASESTHGSAREVFFKLCDAEQYHYDVFRRVHEEVLSSAGRDPGESILDVYLEKFIKTGIFPSPEEYGGAIDGIKATFDALMLGLKAENVSVGFYTAAVEMTKNPAGKKIFEGILEEEKEHVKWLNREIKKLAPGDRG